MNPLKRRLKQLVHRWTSTPVGEAAVVALGRQLGGRGDALLRRLAPPPASYPPHAVRLAERHGLKWELRLHDYFQWHQYFHLSDPIAQVLPQLHRDGALALDVGANVGMYSLVLAAAHPRGRVWSFEPNPTTAAALRSNVARNALPNVTVIEAALSDRAGEATLFDAGTGDSGKFSLRGGGRGFVVPVVTLDAQLAAHDGDVSVLKMDVEGFEPEALLGAAATLEAKLPHLVVELTPRWYVDKQPALSRALDLLRRCGYQTFEIGYRGGAPVLTPIGLEELAIGPQRNVLAVARARAMPPALKEWVRR